MSPQSKENIAASENPSLLSAVKNYQKTWPPVYPTALWVFAHFGFQFKYFNLFSFFILLILVWVYFRLYLENINPFFPISLLAVTHAIYINMHQPVSETLFILFGFVIMMLIANYRNRPTLYGAFFMGLFSSIAVLTRFFGLFWLVPIAMGHLWFSNVDRPHRVRNKHVAVFLSVFSIIAAPWIVYLKISTGFFSGFDRTSPRNLPEPIAHWNQLTDFSTNVLFLLKTVLVDFFSSHSFASHDVVERDLPLKELIIFLFFVILAVWVALVVIHAHRKTHSSIKALSIKLLVSPQALPFQFAAFYIISIVCVWTLTNNDPLYTRFMYPSYVFIILSMFSLYSWIKRQAATGWHNIPFYLIYFLFVTMNSHKILIQVTGVDYFKRLLSLI
jgi:hypothetical protein